MRLVAVADAVAERAHENAVRFGVPSHFGGVEAMLAGVELDLVIVATPVQRHFADALAAVEAGKHVYVQKAMTSTLDQANQLLAARDRAGVKLSAAPGYELCTTTEAMRRVVDDGVIGHVYAAFTYTFGIMLGRSPQPGQRDPLAEIDPTWNFQPAGGGPLPSITVYSLQLASSLLGPVRSVTALANHHLEERRWAGKTIPVEIADNTIVLMEFASGALGTAIGSACNLVDVEGVLLGGGLTEVLGEPFVRRVERAIRPRLLANEPPLEVRRTSLGDMAGAIGAALLVHEPLSPS
jgi:predicted dehydrogenase